MATKADQESMNIHRMQLALTKMLTTPNRLTGQSLRECHEAVYELDMRLAQVDKDMCSEWNNLEKKQQDIVRTLQDINIQRKLSINEDTAEDESESLIIANTQDKENSSPVSRNKSKEMVKGDLRSQMSSKSSTTKRHVTDKSNGPLPDEDISSSADIQTLLLQQKNISAREIAEEEKTQRELTSELLELTSLLKENTIVMNETINIQNTQLGEMFEHAEDNVEELDEQKDKMNKQQQLQSNSLWTTVYALVSVFVTFSLTYAVIRIFPKPA